jgi:2-amino-4-hydroxy-6-hydroxymethyldihydropteridine diphosphokinase
MPTPSMAFIAVGANIRPESNIQAALVLLCREARVLGSSTFYRTKPIGRSNQPEFINGVWRLETSLPPGEIRDRLLRPIEEELGRRRGEDKFAPRTIDLDLVLYDDWVVSDGGLTLPHPDVSRPFVHIPVTELLADIPAQEKSDLVSRIRSLLPQKTSTASPGERLDDFTERLRATLRR